MMAPSHAQKGQTRYRYYVARSVLDGSTATSPIRRLSAGAIEPVVLTSLREAIGAGAQVSDQDLVAAHLKQVSVHPHRLELHLHDQDEPIVVSWSSTTMQRRRDIIAPASKGSETLRAMRTKDRARILRAIGKARGWMRDLTGGRLEGTDAIAAREAVTERSVRMTLSLAQLAPSIVKALVDGRLPRGIAIRDLVDLPASWTEQERALGIG